MSRDFELLQRVELERGEHARHGMPLAAPTVEEKPFAASMAPLPAITDDAAIVPCLQPADTLTEIAKREVVKLVQQIFLAPESTTTAVVITAVQPHSASSLITATAADTLAAHTDASVCVIDANFWFPTLHDHFGLQNRCGLSELLAETYPALQQAARVEHNLWLIPAGTVNGNRSRVASEQMRLRIAELRQQFRFLLVHAPSIELGNYAVSLGQMTDGAVLVLEADETRRETAQRAKEEMEASGVQVLGAVLNNRKFPIPAALYAML